LPINAEYELKKQLEEEIKKINNLVEKINHLSKIQKEKNYSQYFQKIIFPNE
jgi:DNA polymerase elongation subunit (family B)